MGHPRGMAELAGVLGVEKAGLTGLVDRTERRGLAQRAPVPGDRRAVHVSLTTAGRLAAASFRDEVSAELAKLLAGLPVTERERFRRCVAWIIEANGAPPIFAPACPVQAES